MSLDSLIAIFGIAIAVYSLLPRRRRLDLGLRYGFPDLLILVTGVLAVHYLLFFAFFAAHGLTPRRGLSKCGLQPRDLAYLVVLATGVILLIRGRTAPLSRRRLQRLRGLLQELLREGRYSELLALVASHLDQVRKGYAADYFLSRLRKGWSESAEMRAFLEIGGHRTRGTRLRNWLLDVFHPVLHRLAPLLPAYAREQEAAQDIVRSVFAAEQPMTALVQLCPSLGLRLLDCRFAEADEIRDLYFKTQLRNPASPFSSEIRNLWERGDYDVPPEPGSYPALRFLLADAQMAYRLSVWKPVGDEVLRQLDLLCEKAAPDTLNQTLGDFDESGRWTSPIFVGLCFFDIMLQYALRQKIEWHMWLYYYPLIMEAIVRNYKPTGALYEPDREWPIRYSYVIYTMLCVTRSWIRTGASLPPSQRVDLGAEDASLENGNILKSAILAMCQMLRIILPATSLELQFRKYAAGIVLDVYVHLREEAGVTGYAKVLRAGLITGGRDHRSEKDDGYRTLLVDVIEDAEEWKFDARIAADLAQSINGRGEP